MNQYRAITSRTTWKAAQEQCEDMDMELAVPRNEQENNLIYQVMTHHQPYWLGISGPVIKCRIVK